MCASTLLCTVRSLQELNRTECVQVPCSALWEVHKNWTEQNVCKYPALHCETFTRTEQNRMCASTLLCTVRSLQELNRTECVQVPCSALWEVYKNWTEQNVCKYPGLYSANQAWHKTLEWPVQCVGQAGSGTNAVPCWPWSAAAFVNRFSWVIKSCIPPPPINTDLLLVSENACWIVVVDAACL